MSDLQQSTEFHSVTVRAVGYLEVRVDQVIRDGEQEVVRTPHRHVLSPGDDVTNEDPKVRAIASVTWTPEIVAAYKADLAQRMPAS